RGRHLRGGDRRRDADAARRRYDRVVRGADRATGCGARGAAHGRLWCRDRRARLGTGAALAAGADCPGDRARHRGAAATARAPVSAERGNRAGGGAAHRRLRMKTFNLPDLGEGLQEAEIVSWYVAVGDRVVADQPLVSVETDKAVVEVPAPYSGKVARLCAEPGSTLAVGGPLVEFEELETADTGTVAGRLPTAETRSRAEERSRDGAGVPGRRPGHRIKATPAVRQLAKSLGVYLAIVGATGAEGQLTQEDIRRA